MPFEPTAAQLATLRAPRLISVVGAPCVGKATVSKALARRLDATVFDLRTFARAQGAQPLPVRDTVDPRGEYADPVVDDLLRLAILHDGITASDRPVILPDFPITVAHLTLLHNVARSRGLPLTVLELDADNDTLISLARLRRQCLACFADPDGYPHDLVYPDLDTPTRCDTCSGPLSVRRADQATAFFARLSRYREQRPGLNVAAKLARIPWAEVQATTTSAAVPMSLRVLTVTDPPDRTVRDRRADADVPCQRPGTPERPESA